MKTERLDKLLSGSGQFTRSEARALIAAGAVTVDGVPVRRPEAKVPRESDVRASGQPVDTAEFVYYMLDKPAAYVSASKAEGRYPPVTELLPPEARGRGVFCVGRLDADVTGLLLLTDDGDYAHRVTSPRAGVEKTYEARLDAPLTEDDVLALAAGAVLPDGTVYRPAAAAAGPEPCVWRITVTEGKYHEVKTLIARCGRELISLRRVSVGGLVLDDGLTPGAARRLRAEEAQRVFIKLLK